MRWLEGAARARLTEPSCGRKVNMLAEPEPAGGFGKGAEPLSQRCPTLYPRRKLARCAESGSVPTWRCPARCKVGPRNEMVATKFPFLMIAQSLDVSICPPPALEMWLFVSPAPLTVFSQLP